MLTFKFFKRLLALIVVLLVAVSADAQMKTYTVSNTNSSGSGSFKDALETVNEKKGRCNIVFDLSKGSEVTCPSIVIEGLEELNFIGSEDLIIKYDNGLFGFNDVQSLSFENIKFKSEGSWNVPIRIDQENKIAKVAFIKNCIFDGVEILSEYTKNAYIEIDLISDCVFNKSKQSLSGPFVINKLINTSILDCESFSGKTNEYKLKVIDIEGCTISNTNTYIEAITVSKSKFNAGPFYQMSLLNCELVSDCHIENINPFENAIKLLRDSFVCTDGRKYRTEAETFENCLFDNFIVNAEKTHLIKGCKFIGNLDYFIHSTTEVDLEISGCEFYNKNNSFAYSDITLPTRLCKITNNLFDSSHRAIENTGGLPGFYSRNIMKNKSSIKDDGDKSINPPVIQSVTFNGSKLEIKGKSVSNSTIEFFNSSSNFSSDYALMYIGSVKTGKDGSFVYSFNVLEWPEFCFRATTTTNGKNTSELSDKACFELPSNIYVKENGEGDGSSWDKAMSPTTFATVLPLASNGTTFHVAQGRYIPIYDANMKSSEKGLLYTIKSDVKIIGGYDPDELDETAANDPIKYHTVFTTDPSGDNTYVSHYINDPSKDDVGSSTGIFTMPGAKNVTFDGVEFIGCSSLKGDFKVNLNISRCTFKLTNSAVTDVRNLTIDNCLFMQMAIGSGPSTFIGGVDGDFVLSNSTVTEVSGTAGYVLSGDFETHHAKSMTLVNNTFAGNSGVKFAGFNSLINTGYGYCKMYNNTFVNNLAGSNGVIEGSPSGLEFVGNLIIANEGVESISDAIGNLFFDEDDDVIYGNNLYDFEGYKGDLQTKEEYLVNFVDGTYESGVFKANLNKNGGYTPTVALTAFSDGHDTDIRFSKKATIVDKDQRGVTRQNSTCPGAYEKPFIVPDSKEIYVKKSGNGSGANWKEAMSEGDFYSVLPIAKKGTTFHIAAGTYKKNGNSSAYEIKTDVILIGGYPSDAQKGAVSDPVNNHTVFKVLPGSDGYSEKTQHVFFHGNARKSDIEFHNIDFDHASIQLEGQNIVIDSCNFYESQRSVQINVAEKTRISNSFFAKNSSELHDGEIDRAVGLFNVDKGLIENCTFDAQPFTCTIWIDTARVDVINNTFLLRERTFSDYEKKNGKMFYLYFGGDAKRTLFKNNTVVTVSTSGQMKKLNNDGFIFFKSANIYSNLFAVGNPDILNTSKIPNVSSDNSTSDLNMVGNLLGYENNTQNLTGSNNSVNYLEELESILDGKKEGNSFIPMLKYNGGYTPTIKLIKDKLSEGTSIRVNKSSTYTATTDQRGVTRLTSTCVGAYEIDDVEVNENLELKSAIAKVYGTECTNGEGYLDVSWARKTYNANQQFKLVVKNEDEKVFEGPLQDMSKGSGTFQISGLKPGTYTYSFYIKKEGSFVPANKFNISFQYQFYTAVGEVPSGDKFIVKYVKPSIPNPQVNKSSIKVSKPYCYSQTGNGSVQLKIGNWVDGCKAYFYKGEKELWSVDALDSPNNNYNLKVADNAVEDLYNGARHVDSVVFNYSGLSGGSYSFVLEDLCGNKTTTPITVDPIEKPSFVVSKSSKTELSCYNSTDGSIEITLVGGELELCGKVSSYDIKGLEFTEKNRTVKATGLTPGSYRFVYGTTAKMCSDQADTIIVITAPDTVDAKCDFKDAYCAEIGGSATFDAKGGMGDYSVTIRDISGNVFKKESFAGKNTVTVGGMKLMTTYSAVVEDGNGCKSKELGGIRFWTKPIPQLKTSLAPSSETCYGRNNGRIRLTYSGNNDKDVLVVSAIGSDGKPHNTYFSETEGSVMIENLAPGEYTVKFGYGAEGCNTPDDNATTIGKVTIGKVDKPTLLDVSDVTVIRCEGTTLSREIEVTNYNKKLYTWTLTKDGVDITSKVDATVPTTEDGEFVFKGLTAGDYVFSLVDQCGNPFSKSFTVLESLKKAMKVVDNSGGVSCEGKSDAYFDINVTNWNTGDKCLITNAETGKELEVSKTTKGTYISLFSYHLPGGKYNVDVTDLCGTTYPTVVIDLDELGKDSKFGLSLAEAASDAECNEDSRKISATVTGRETGSTYSYTLYQVNGKEEKVIDDKQKEVADKTYTSGKLDYGTYKLAAVTSEGCEASVERTFSASHSLTGTRLVCGENSHVELNYDGLIEGVSVKIDGNWSDIDFAEGADKSSFDCKGVVTDARVKETGCYTVAALSDYDLTGNQFEGVTAKASAVDQTCYGKDNGSIKVTYSGYKGKMQVVAYAVNDKGDKLPSVFDPEQKCLLISNLAPGAYNVQLGLSIEGCEVSGQSFDVAKAISIAALEKPEFLEDRYGVAHNQCEGMAKGRMHLEMNGWKDGIYTWSLQRSYDQGKPAEYTHCGEKLNGATTFDLWSLPEGKTIFTMWDACDTIYKKVENIKAAYVDPVEIKMGDCTPISCADRTDGSVIFVASHWDIPYQASVILDGDTALKDFRPVIKADGKAYFELKGQGAGIYQLATKDACERTVDSEPFDFTAFSAQNGMLTVKAVFDEDAEECEIGKRVIKATATGGTAPYIFSIEKNGTAVETSEAIDATSYGSKLLGEGKYTVSVTDKTDCKAVYGENLTIKSEKLNVKLGTLTNIEQTCYGKDNAGVSVSYSGFDTEVAKLRLLVTEKTEAETKKTYEAYADANEGTLAYTKLPTGTYDVKVQLLGFNGCEMSNGVLLEKEITIEALEKPEFLEDRYGVAHNQCEGMAKGRMHLEMNGWKDGIYTWSLQRSFDQGKPAEYTHCGEKLNGATTFDLWSLPEGKTIFTMWDACDTIYKKVENIKAAYVGPVKIKMGDCTPISCADRTDGSVIFVASHWDIPYQASVILDGDTALKDFRPVIKAGGKAYFELKGQGAGIYQLATKDACERTVDSEPFDFTAFSAQNGMLTVKAVFDEDAEECEIGKRVIKATATGGTAPYIFSIEKNGTAVETSEAIDATSYGSKLLGEGKYTVSVTDKTDCKAVYGENLTIKSEKLNVKLGSLTNIEQTCYGKDNAGVSVSYSGFDTEMAKLRLLVTEKTEAETKKTYEAYADANEGTLAYTKLPTGTYDVKVQLLGFNGCEMSNGVLLEKEITIEALEKPEFLEDRYGVAHNQCEGMAKGRMHLEMNGWKDGIYTWSLQRSFDQGKPAEYTHCGEKLNGATTFDLWSLPEGKTIFTMWDACDTIYKKVENIKAAYVGPVKIKMGDCTPISCADRTDGSVIFVASHWDIPYQASVILDGDTALKDFRPVIKADGKAYFELKGQGAGIYQLATKDACERTVDSEPFDFTAFSAQNGMLTVDVDFDAEAAKCDVEKRIFKVTATGGTAPYIYTITKGEATVQTTEATEKKSFNSQLLADGTYVVTVTDKTDCKAVYDDGLTIKPSHTMKADMHEVACGDGKSVTISTLVDGGETSTTKFVAVDETGKEYQPSSAEGGVVLCENVPVSTTLKGLIAEVDGCKVYAEMGTLPLDATALAEAKVTVDKVINERCYGAKDGGLKLSYNGPKSSYDVAMRLVGVNGTTATINTPNKRGTNLSFEFEKLAPGEYELYLVQKVGQCDAGTEPKKIQKVKIKEMPHKFELLWDTVIQSICFSEMNATDSLKVRGWSEGNCTWTLDKVKNDYYTDIDKLLYPVSNTDAYPVSGDTAYWGSAKLSAGRYTVTWTACNTTVSKEFEIKPLKEPSLKVLASSNTDLKCNYDKAYVDFHYEGGSPVNKRILIKYLPVGSSSDDWDFTNEELKAENTYRLYGFTPGSGNMGHKKAVGITYKLTDEDKGLPDGKYTIVYEDTTGACEKDNLSAVVTVRRNNPINIQAYKRDVVCNEKAQGTLAFTFGRPGYTWPSYTDDSYMDKYTGVNWASLIFMSEKDQEKMYRREVNQSFTVYTNEQLELLKKTYEKYGSPKQALNNIIEQYKNSIPFRSNMFSDVKKVELIARGVSQEKLYSRLAQTLDTLMKYPLEEMYKNGLNYKVPTDWMGFNTLYADYYNVVVTDTFGCRYVSDTIHISMPNYQKPLTIDNMVYDDKEGFCDADKRRITFRVSGGWGDYHYSAVNLDSADVEKSLADLPDNPDEGVSYGKLLDKNYVADARIETHGTKGTPDYYEIYTTPIQKPGRIRVSVVDSLGCKTNGQDITLTAKYLMSGLTQNDWCSPDEKNNFYPVLLNGDKSPTAAQVDSFKVRIGHRTVRDDSVEYRKVLPSELVLNTRTTDGTQYYGKKYIEKVPGGQIGFFAYMEDGCSAFGEYDFGMRDDFRELKLTAEGTIPSYCYNDSTGALLFSIYGGNEYYKKLYLDDVDLMSNSGKELITKHLVTTEHVEENNVDKVKVDTTDYDLTFNDFTSKELFADLNKVYGNQFKKDPDPVQYSYYFTLQNLGGNTHLVNPLREDTFHTLVVEDTKGCRDTLAFKVDQPEMLYIRAAGSVMCADGSGRIYVDSVAGGVGGYRYSLDKTNIFDENTHKKVMFDGVTKHTLSVTDDHGCFSLPSSPISTGESISWDDVEQDVMISTWHDYGDALVVIDKTNYHRLKYNTKGSPYYGKPYDYHYDSIKVEIIRGDGFPEQIVGKIQPKEFYTYGIPSQKFANVENGDTDVDTTGMHIDGSVSVYIPWLEKHVQGPSWGVPAEVVATVKTDEQLKFMDVQYGLEVAALNDTVNMKIDKICGCGYLNNLSKLSLLLQKEYPTQSDKNNIQYLENVINSIKTTKVNNTDKTIEETAKKQVGYSDKVDALKKKYGFGYGTLSQIREVFTKLVPDSAAERMTFIKFEEIRGTNSDGTPAPSVLDKYFNTETESEVLPFAIRTTTYISGCDITEEYNPLILNLKGDNPYPDPDFRNSIKLECVPSILSNNQSQTELIVRLSRPENFSYQVFGLDGRLIKAKTANTVVPVTQTSADGKEESVYTITLTGISQSSVVKVCTDSDCAATKVLVR